MNDKPSYEELEKRLLELQQAERESRKTKASLREKEQVMQYIIKHDPNALAVYDRDLHYIAVSDRYLQDYDLAEADILGKHHYDVFPEMPQRWKEVHKRVLEGAVEKNDDDWFERSDGSITYNRWECRPWYKADDFIGGMITYTEVTTERKLAERALRKSEYKYRQLVDLAQEGIWVIDTDGLTTFVNPSMALMLEYSPAEMVGKHIFSFMDEKGVELAQEKLDVRQRGIKEQHDFEFIRKDGSRIITTLVTAPIHDDFGRYSGAIAGVVDITKRKKAEEKLVEAQKFAKLGWWEFDIKNDRVTWSEEIYAIFGVTHDADPLRLETMMDFISPDYREYHQAITELLLQSGSATFEYPIHRPDGQRSWIWGKGKLVVDSNGTPTHMFGIAQDITERKKIEQESHILKTAIDQAPIGIALANEHMEIYYCNPEGLSMRGGSREDFVQIPKEAFDNWQVFTLNGKPYEIEGLPLVRAMKTGKAIREELIVKHQEGIEHICDAFACPVFENTQIIGGIVIFLDITEKMKLQKQLNQAQKMEAIGNLAGGIAHDFNNILASILGFTEIALDDVPKGTELEDNLQEVYSAGKRARDLVKQILAFARQSEDKKSPIQPAMVAKEVLKLMRSTIPATIEIQQEIESDSWVMGNATQIHQVLMNLCTNAAHAMEDSGGVLKVGMQELFWDNVNSPVGMTRGDYVEIQVSDTGSGISPEIIGSIFDPYFTTKKLGEGTGMGLAVAHGVIESSRGKITVDSQLGQGTTFTIFLPITKKRSGNGVYSPEQLPTGTEHILFVDDEAPITTMGRKLLEQLGYSVTTRTSSIEALELFQAKPDDFDLVLTDMTMPNMTGDKLAVELMKIRPDVPVILCTGYSKKISEETASDKGIRAFAYKPMVKADLAKTIRKVLDRPSSGNQT